MVKRDRHAIVTGRVRRGRNAIHGERPRHRLGTARDRSRRGSLAARRSGETSESRGRMRSREISCDHPPSSPVCGCNDIKNPQVWELRPGSERKGGGLTGRATFGAGSSTWSCPSTGSSRIVGDWRVVQAWQHARLFPIVDVVRPSVTCLPWWVPAQDMSVQRPSVRPSQRRCMPGSRDAMPRRRSRRTRCALGRRKSLSPALSLSVRAMSVFQ